MIFQLVLIALVITLEPIPLTAFILVLASEGGVRKGAAFIFGWLLSLAAVVTLTVVATGNDPPKPNTAPSLGRDRPQAPHRRGPGDHRPPTPGAARAAEETQEPSEMANGHRQHVAVGGHRPGSR